MKTRVLLTTLIALLLSFTSASAANFNIDNLFQNPGFIAVSNSVAGPLTGMYNLTFVGAEAGYDNAMIKFGGETIFRNSSATAGDTYANVDISLAKFQNGPTATTYDANVWSDHVQIHQLIQDVMVNSIAFSAGTYLLGFNDLATDCDFDDMIVAANPVPVPAAAWMLGAGLLGVMGLRRKKN